MDFKGFQSVLAIQNPRKWTATFENINHKWGMTPGSTGWLEMVSILQNHKADEISSFATGKNCPILLNTTRHNHSLSVILDWFWGFVSELIQSNEISGWDLYSHQFQIAKYSMISLPNRCSTWQPWTHCGWLHDRKKNKNWKCRLRISSTNNQPPNGRESTSTSSRSQYSRRRCVQKSYQIMVFQILSRNRIGKIWKTKIQNFDSGFLPQITNH